ncbi:MAG: alpha-amylase, partial [Planctomycetaceae bacterium]
MYRAFAHDRRAQVNLGIRRRLAPLLGNNRRRIELMNALLFSLPGTPVIYYGDEIGLGDNIYLGDRNGVRTPMQWSADRNAGFSRANPQKLFLPIIIDPEYHYEAINVQAQQNNPSSLLWWNKRLISLRRKHKAFGRGSIEFLHPANNRILAFIREHEHERLLVVANLSRFVQYVELDLSKYPGVVPVELFGGTPFPRIGATPYLLTLSPHAIYWFSISHDNCPDRVPDQAVRPSEPPEIRTNRNWELLFDESGARQLEKALLSHFNREHVTGPWRVLRAVRLHESFRLTYGNAAARLAIVELDFNQGDPETRVVPLAWASAEEDALRAPGGQPPIVARISGGSGGVLFNALHVPAFCDAILNAVSHDETAVGSEGGELVAWRAANFDAIRGPADEYLRPVAIPSEQSNRSIRFGDRLILKAYRRIEEGLHPELEIGRLLTTADPRPCVAPLAGVIEYRQHGREPMALAVVHGYVGNEGDAWQHTLDHLSAFFEGVATMPPLDPEPTPPLSLPLGSSAHPVPESAANLIHGYVDTVRLLGQRLGELHLALACASDHPEFAPEAVSAQYQRSIYQSMRNILFDVTSKLDREKSRIPPDLAELATQVRQMRGTILNEFRVLTQRRIHGIRIRCHG